MVKYSWHTMIGVTIKYQEDTIMVNYKEILRLSAEGNSQRQIAAGSGRLCSEFSVNARFHDKTVHILRSSEPEAEAEPPPMAARSVLDRLA